VSADHRDSHVDTTDVLDVAATEVVRYPPNGRLQVPIGTRRGASAAVATSMACKRAPLALHHGAALYTWLFGARALPGARARADAGLEHASEVFAACRSAVGAFDAVALVTRRQEERSGMLALLLRDDEPVAFVKAAPQGSGHGLEVERACLSALSAERDAPVSVPAPLGGGVTASNIGWTAMEPLPPRPHRPAWSAPVSTVVAWLQDGLDGVLPLATDAPAHWRPMHGDFAPWNLRRVFRGPLVLFDFEDAGFAPPEADRTYWKVTSAVLRGDRPSSVLDGESRDYWHTVVAARLERAVDPDLDQRLLAAFRP
jgi:hypothetical protein